MIPILAFIASVISAYLVGSIPTGFIMAKIFKGIDIRQVGSSNVGATNVLRTVGKLPALITLLIDMLKGVFAVTVIANFFYSFNIDFLFEFYQPFLGLVAICGHIWTIFLRFKGGKGVATMIGVMVVISPSVFLVSGAIWLLVFTMSSYVSLASLAMGLALPISAVVMNKSIYLIIFNVTICALISYKHKDNIKRLLKKEEHKTIIFKKKAISS